MNSSTSSIKKAKRTLLKRHLKESLKSHKHLFSCDSDAIYAMDLDGYFIPLNPACEIIFGYDTKQFSKMSYMKVMKLEHLERSLSFFYKSIEGKLQNFDCQIVHKSGELVDLNITNYPIVIEEEIVGVYGIAKDITELKQKRRKLKENEALYQLLTDNSLDMISKTSPEGIFHYVSPYCKELLGYDASELIGTSFLDYVHPDELVKVAENRKFINSGQGNGQVTFRMKLKSGNYLWIETLCKPIINETNSVIEIISVFRDISARIQAKEKIRQREKTYKDLVEHSPDAVVIAREEQILFANDTAVELLGGSQKKDILGRSLYDFVDRNFCELVKSHGNIVETGETVNFIEEKVIRSDGKTIEVEIKSLPAIFENEPARHIIIRDITEKKKTEQLLLHSEKLSVAGQLAAGIAHEIRNPLTVIKGFLQLMESNNKSKVPYLGIIQSEMDRIELILSELLLLSKPQEMVFKKQNLNRIINHVKALIDTQAIMENIEINITYLTDISVINCDENQLKQMFINFLKNSIEAMPDGGQIAIEVDASTNPKGILIRLRDQGAGIPEEHLSRIGQPFFTTKENGTGLGLMISKQIIENHHGTIDISSNPNGTTIEVLFPFQD